ncbi:MAG: hypothetical protein JOY58_08710 [Solirubrobacterales bacterium]|nr:hypothetical protein [Solirubrobacterales bacterium]MBV9048337.1 hypothetical protein [Solirubrobacterales bacterium]
MNAQLTHLMAQQRSAELQLAFEQARLASEVSAGGHRLRPPKLITRSAARRPKAGQRLQHDRDIATDGVELRRETVTSIEPTAGPVRITAGRKATRGQ